MKPPFRTGFGFDVHRWKSERKLFIGGIEIPHTAGLDGHSDADVLLHAICDALLGAAGLRDIGYHFPDQDLNYKNIDSKILLSNTKVLLEKSGWLIGNIDCTLVMEAPKINPYIIDMKNCIASLLNIDATDLGIKATTNESMGFIGRGEGAAAYATVLIYK